MQQLICQSYTTQSTNPKQRRAALAMAASTWASTTKVPAMDAHAIEDLRWPLLSTELLHPLDSN